MRIGEIVRARGRFDAVGEGKERKAKVDCIYAAVSNRQMPSDERIEFILCRHERNTGMRWLYSLDVCDWRRFNN